MTDVFEVCRKLDMVKVAEVYGFEPNRGGFIRCPFHGGDRTPSLKLYSNSWYCFGCSTGGDAVTFVSKLYGLAPLESVKRLNSDFNLHLPLDRRVPTAQERTQARRRRELMDTRKMYELWRDQMLLMLNTSYRAGHLALRDKPPAAWTDAEATAVRWLDALEYWADALDGSTTEQMAVFRNRRGVERLCGRILANESLTKSLTA